MKKIVYILLIMFISICVVKAQEWPNLDSLNIKNVDYDIHFDPNKYDYYLPVDKNIDKLDIEYTTKEGYKVEITGNENLKVGSNKIVIEVSYNDAVVNYTINVQKRNYSNEEEEEEKVFPIMQVGLGLAITGIVIGIIVLIKGKKTS